MINPIRTFRFRRGCSTVWFKGFIVMLNIKKILLPVDFPVASFGVINQAAMLARSFKSEMVMLHAVTPRSHAAGVPEDSREWAEWDLLAAIIGQAQKQHQYSLGAELQGLAVQCKLVTGDAAEAIVQSAQEEKADLIMMPSHSFTFYQFLMGSVTARVLHGTECPVWTGAHIQVSPAQNFAIRNVLCAVDFGPRCEKTVSWADQMAAEFGARLTLANVTAALEMWGAGGNYVDQRQKEKLIHNATQQMAKLKEATGVKADVFIGSGDVPKVLSQAAQQIKADLLVTGTYPYGGHLRTHGYGIICALPIPVVSV
jgi:nucleotide-binding universal stress UspA family protein